MNDKEIIKYVTSEALLEWKKKRKEDHKLDFSIIEAQNRLI